MRFLKETMETEGSVEEVSNSQGLAKVWMGAAVEVDVEEEEVQIIMENVERKRVTIKSMSKSKDKNNNRPKKKIISRLNFEASDPKQEATVKNEEQGGRQKTTLELVVELVMNGKCASDVRPKARLWTPSSVLCRDDRFHCAECMRVFDWRPSLEHHRRKIHGWSVQNQTFPI
jgi:hypothetical protein